MARKTHLGISVAILGIVSSDMSNEKSGERVMLRLKAVLRVVAILGLTNLAVGANAVAGELHHTQVSGAAIFCEGTKDVRITNHTQQGTETKAKRGKDKARIAR